MHKELAEGLSTSLPLQQPGHSVTVPMDVTFEVTLKRNSLGLGLSITGGPDAPEPLTNYIRIKKIFPLQPAWETGQLQEGDVLLSAGGQVLYGMSLRQALDVLRSSPPVTTLLVSRQLPEKTDDALPTQTASSRSVMRSYSCYTPATTISLSLPPLSSSSDAMEYDESVHSFNQNGSIWVDPIGNSLLKPTSSKTSQVCGEFSIVVDKINGSLGFSLKSDPEDTTALRHSVRALVREPALSDGRIRPGDNLISANDEDCSVLSHAELISFLRHLPEKGVRLKLYRDASRAQTPVSPAEETPFETSPRHRLWHRSAYTGSHSDLSISARQKQLRYEAQEMVKSLQASRSSLDGSRNGSNCSGRKVLVRRTCSPKPHPICNSASSPSPFVKNVIELEIDYSEQQVEPMVESPMSPVKNCQNFLPTFDRLQIEELPPPGVEFNSEATTERHHDCLLDVPFVYNNSSQPPPPPSHVNRPSNLDLFKSAGNRPRKGFVFNPFANNNK